VTDRCGTYAGWQAHQRAGVKACEPCRLARNEWTREHRRKPEVAEKRRAVVRARDRALARLAREYPARYLQLLREESA
jgi:hypothetical protein